jgi:hypothetical protein
MAKFSLKKFVMKTLTAMRDAGEDEYKIMQYALKYYEKGVLTDDDLAEVEGWFEVQEEEDEETSDLEEFPEETEITEI